MSAAILDLLRSNLQINLFVILVLAASTHFSHFPSGSIRTQLLIALCTLGSFGWDLFVLIRRISLGKGMSRATVITIRVFAALMMTSKAIVFYAFLRQVDGAQRVRKYLHRRFRLFLFPFEQPKRIMRDVRGRYLALAWIHVVSLVMFVTLWVVLVYVLDYNIFFLDSFSSQYLAWFLAGKAATTLACIFGLWYDIDVYLCLLHFGCCAFTMPAIRRYIRQRRAVLGGYPLAVSFYPLRFFLWQLLKGVDLMVGVGLWVIVGLSASSRRDTEASMYAFLASLGFVLCVSDIWSVLIIVGIRWLLSRYKMLQKLPVSLRAAIPSAQASFYSDDSELDDFNLRCPVPIAVDKGRHRQPPSSSSSSSQKAKRQRLSSDRSVVANLKRDPIALSSLMTSKLIARRIEDKVQSTWSKFSQALKRYGKGAQPAASMPRVKKPRHRKRRVAIDPFALDHRLPLVKWISSPFRAAMAAKPSRVLPTLIPDRRADDHVPGWEDDYDADNGPGAGADDLDVSLQDEDERLGTTRRRQKVARSDSDNDSDTGGGVDVERSFEEFDVLDQRLDRGGGGGGELHDAYARSKPDGGSASKFDGANPMHRWRGSSATKRTRRTQRVQRVASMQTRVQQRLLCPTVDVWRQRWQHWRYRWLTACPVPLRAQRVQFAWPDEAAPPPMTTTTTTTLASDPPTKATHFDTAEEEAATRQATHRRLTALRDSVCHLLQRHPLRFQLWDDAPAAAAGSLDLSPRKILAQTLLVDDSGRLGVWIADDHDDGAGDAAPPSRSKTASWLSALTGGGGGGAAGGVAAGGRGSGGGSASYVLVLWEFTVASVWAKQTPTTTAAAAAVDHVVRVATDFVVEIHLAVDPSLLLEATPEQRRLWRGYEEFLFRSFHWDTLPRYAAVASVAAPTADDASSAAAVSWATFHVVALDYAVLNATATTATVRPRRAGAPPKSDDSGGGGAGPALSATELAQAALFG
eukprot:gene6882-4955_t